MSNLDPQTIAWMVFWVGIVVTVLLLCGYLANRPRNLLDLDSEIAQAEGRLRHLHAERARRFPNHSMPKPRSQTFRDLANEADRMDSENQ